MAPRLARAVLALLCAVSVIYGTALFPAAFDVDLRTGDRAPSSVGPATPAGLTETDSGAASADRDADATGPDGSDDRTATRTATRTPEQESTPAAGSGGSSGSAGDGGFFGLVSGLLLLGFLGGSALVFVALLRDVRGELPFGFSHLGVPDVVPSLSLRRVPQLTTWLLLSAAGGLARVVDDVSALRRALTGTLAAGVGPAVRTAGRSLAALPRVAAALVTGPVRTLGTALTLLGGLSFLRGGLSRPRPFASDAPTVDARSESDAVPAQADGDDSVDSVLDAWRAMTDLVPVRNPEATTAAEYARKAVDAGLPAGPVDRLTELFREVRYGGGRESTDRIAAARRALDDLTGGDD